MMDHYITEDYKASFSFLQKKHTYFENLTYQTEKSQVWGGSLYQSEESYLDSSKHVLTSYRRAGDFTKTSLLLLNRKQYTELQVIYIHSFKNTLSFQKTPKLVDLLHLPKIT